MAELNTTPRRIASARRALEAAGWIVLPPSERAATRLLDQCEYPDRLGEPGDTCTCSAERKRSTRHGWLWLCPEHINRPASELFDARVQP